MELPDGIDKLLGTKTVEKLYEDGISAPAKELSKVGVDLIKTARLFLAPFQLAAAFQDRFEKLVYRIRERVPENRYIEAPPEIVGPAIENMRYLNDDSLLWEMFEELLSRSVDKQELSKAHPSFVHIISQLSRDEAVILYNLRSKDFHVVDTLELNKKENRFENLKIEESDIPTEELFLPDKIHLYYSHLESLSLVAWPLYKQDPIKDDKKVQTGVRRYSKMHLTEFGRLFVSACIPENGFKNLY